MFIKANLEASEPEMAAVVDALEEKLKSDKWKHLLVPLQKILKFKTLQVGINTNTIFIYTHHY